MRSQFLCVLAVVIACSMATAAQAEIIAQYHLGEAGSVGASNIPLDTANGNNFLNPIGSATVVPVTGGAPGSTSALNFTGAQGYYYTAAAFIPADNYRIDIWANPSESQFANFLTVGVGVDGGITIGMDASGGTPKWIAGHYNIDYIGAVGGAGQPATLNVWTKLSVEQVGGISTFYINDVPQAGTSSYVNSSVNDGTTIHLAVAPGGYSYFKGSLDELTVSAAPIPEPSVLAMLIVGLFGFIAYAWRKRK